MSSGAIETITGREGRRRWSSQEKLRIVAETKEGSGERAATIYSLTETAKLNALDPEDYLPPVLEQIAEHPVKRVHELLP
jgi:hypothetical protein